MLVVVEGGKREAEAALVVAEPHVGAVGEVAVDGRALGRRMDEAVVYLQVLEEDGDVAVDRWVDGIEEGKAVCAAKDQRTVGQAAGGAVVELVASQAVGGKVVGEAVHRAVVLAQAVHGAHPEVAHAVLLDAADVGTGSSGYRRKPMCLGVVVQQSVGHGAYPQLPVRVGQDAGGDELRAADTLRIVALGYRQFTHLQGGVVHQPHLVPEAGHQQLAVGRWLHGRDEGVPLLKHLQRFKLRFARPQHADVVCGRTHVECAIVTLCETYRHEAGIFLLLHQPVLLVAAAVDFVVGCGYPQLVLPVGKEPGHALLVAGKVFDRLDDVILRVIDVEPVHQGGYPEQSPAVAHHGDDRFLCEVGAQVVVVVEALLVVVAHGVALVQGAYPEVLVRVGVKAVDAEIGCLKGEAVFLGLYHAALLPVVIKKAVFIGIDEDALAAVLVEEGHVALREQRVLAQAGGGGEHLPRLGVEASQLPVTTQPDEAVVVHVGGGEPLVCGDGVAQLQRVGVVAPQGVGLDIPEASLQVNVAAAIERSVGVKQFVDARKGILLRIISVEMHPHIDEDASVAQLQQLDGILVGAGDGHLLKTVAVGIAAYSVDGGHPELAPRVAQQVLNLVVGQRGGVVVVAEVLVILVYVELVQPAEGAHPDVSLCILGDYLHLLVAQVGGDGGSRSAIPFDGGIGIRCTSGNAKQADDANCPFHRVSGENKGLVHILLFFNSFILLLCIATVGAEYFPP